MTAVELENWLKWWSNDRWGGGKYTWNVWVTKVSDKDKKLVRRFRDKNWSWR